MTMTCRLTVIITMGVVLLGVNGKMVASQIRTPHIPARVVWSGVYTQEQAARGTLAYRQFCSRCHREDLSGGEKGPQLKGAAFFDRWHDLTLLDVFTEVQGGMPHDWAVFIPAESARDIVSLLLKESGIPGGDKELPSDFEGLADILITRPPSQAK